MWIIGVELNNKKRIDVALTKIYGIGWFQAKEILKNTKILAETRVKNITEQEIGKIKKYIDDNLIVEGALKRNIAEDIKRLEDIGCRRGIRHRKRLPVRGQNTKNNARTRRGKKGKPCLKTAKKASARKL